MFNIVAEHLATTRKNDFNGGLFLYYLGLKLLLSHLPRVVVFPAIPSLWNMFPGVFLNLRENSFRTPVKYHEFKNLCKIP